MVALPQPSLNVKGTISVVVIGVGRGGVGSDNGPRWRIVRASQGDADDRHLADTPLTPSSSLDFPPPALIIVVANVTLQPRLTGSDPDGTVGSNPTIGVT
jgi:hypothetical protein